MPHYIFHLNRSRPDIAFKDEAHELPNLVVALQKANSRARAVLRRCVRCGPDAVRGTLDIQDANRQPIARIYLSELMRQIS